MVSILLKNISAIYSAMTQFFFPSRCPSCKAYTQSEGQWCKSCFTEISCNKNLSYDEEVRKYISPIIAIGKYDKGLRTLIHELKYKNNLSTLLYFAPLLHELDKNWQFNSFDMVVPVPLHQNKLKKRGFNQVDKIFKNWAIEHKFNYCDILIRSKQTKSQFNLNQEERLLNLQNAFCLKENISTKYIEGKNILLVDDIFTTGSTMKNCAKVLLKHKATKVSGLVLASPFKDNDKLRRFHREKKST